MEDKITIIKPKGRFDLLNIPELIQYRELLLALVNRDFKIRYKQTVIGIIWAVLQPLLTMVVFTVFFGSLSNIQTFGVPYPVFSFAGLLLWTFFTSSITNVSSSLITNSTLISKIYFPRVFIPVSSTIIGVVDYLFAFIFMIPIMILFNYPVSAGILLVPVILIFTWILITGLGLWLAALNVKYRDIRYVVPFLIQIMLFVTPIIYPVSLATNLKNILIFNPMTGLVEAHRALITGTAVDPISLVVAIIISILVFISGLAYFRSTEKNFADLV